MFKRMFKNGTLTAVLPSKKEIINSKIIQEDLLKSFKLILDNASSKSHQSKIDGLRLELETYKTKNFSRI